METTDYDIIPFKALDGFDCNLWRVKKSTRTLGPVVLVHGAGVSSNIFNAPTKKNLPEMLAEEGYDVFLENWRASTEFPANNWDLDQVAFNDHPAAIKKIVAITGSPTVKAIIHCQGSTSFMISAVSGLVPEVTVILSNAVSLHPVVSRFSVFKLKVFIPFVKLFLTYLNPQWGKHAPGIFPKLLKGIVILFHWEKDTLVSKFVSFTYGSGFPALWELKNINPATKAWIQDQFGNVPLRFFDHIKKGVVNGALVPFNSSGTYSYVSETPKTNARFVFFCGELNKCFLPESQQKTFDYFDALNPGKHGLYRMPGYSHLDIFYGKDSYKDIFPKMLYELKQ